MFICYIFDCYFPGSPSLQQALSIWFHDFLKEDKLRGKPGYEHLSDPLHILIEAEFPAAIIDARLRHAQEIIEELLKPVVSDLYTSYIYIC
jgi:hypothetical protein